MLLGHWLIESPDAVTHAAAHAPAQPGITEALGTTDNHTFERAWNDIRRRAEWGKVGRDYWERYFTTVFRYGYFFSLVTYYHSLGFRSLHWDYVIAI